MRIFLTGGTGFIGRHTAHRLAQAGHQLVCLTRPTSDRSVLPAGVQTVSADLASPQHLNGELAGCDALVHLANLYSMWQPDPAEFWQVNVDGTRAVMEAALQAGVKRVVYVSTVAVWGKPARAPFNEDDPPGPRLFSTYARSKAAGSRLVWDMHKKRGLPVVSLHPGIVLGPGDDKPSGQYIQDILRRRVPSVIFCRSSNTYVHVRDTAEAILQAVERPGLEGKRYLIGSEALNGLDYARLICRVSGAPMPPLRLPDPLVMSVSALLTGLSKITRRPPWWGFSIDASRTLKAGFVFDGSRAARELGIRYTPVEQALAEAVAWYRRPGQK